jgi:hypothetical protein
VISWFFTSCVSIGSNLDRYFKELLPSMTGNGALWSGEGSPLSDKVKATNSFKIKTMHNAAAVAVLSLASETEVVNAIMATVGGGFVGQCFADVAEEDDRGRVSQSLMGWFDSDGDDHVLEIAKALETMWATGYASARTNVANTVVIMHDKAEVGNCTSLPIALNRLVSTL